MKLPSSLLLFALLLAPFAHGQAKKDAPGANSQSSAPTDPNTLSKEYRKSATVALASVATWEKTAFGMSSSLTIREDGMYVIRNARARERDALESAERDVRLAKLDAQTTADRELHKRLQQYYETVKVICDATVMLQGN